MSDARDPADEAPTAQSRRRVLQLGAVGASALMTIRPALAQTTGSVLNCEIPIPDARRATMQIAPDGSTVPADTSGAFDGARFPVKGEDVRQAMATGNALPGVEADRSRAYINYVRRLQRGTSGFTCYASLQMPRR